ncbi:Poly(A)-specific ribonuclease PARN [Smittium mucronatum]|uniref:Poly(A)-specific ribonuclease PARN n=1 Tax=Smittium mucronatum TaxID=133383 RepID=A0A1R0H8R8_9FUNG|nr:Poly(A)-specific ribonuclease PARN [Smittium mucronatum]
MDATKDNFDKAKYDFEKNLEKATLISIDLEMSGLWDSFYSKVNSIDNMQMKYEKIRSAAEKFQILQFGVCTFEKKILDNLDNIHQSEDSESPEYEYGISYSTLDQVESMKNEKIRLLEGCNDKIEVSHEQQDFFEDTKNTLLELSNEPHGSTISIPTPNSYFKRLVHQQVNEYV